MYKDLLNYVSVQKNNASILKLCQLHMKYNDSHVQNRTAQNMEWLVKNAQCYMWFTVFWKAEFKFRMYWIWLSLFLIPESHCRYDKTPDKSHELFRPKHTNVMVRILYAFLNIIRYWHLNLILQKNWKSPATLTMLLVLISAIKMYHIIFLWHCLG